MRIAPWLVAALLMGGCAKAPDTTVVDTTPKDAPATKPANDVPEAFRHKGFTYYGLERRDDVSLEIQTPDSSGKMTTLFGKQKVVFDGVKDGKALFTVVRSGVLERIGNDSIVVDSEGVWVVGTTLGKMASKALEIPSDVAPGKTWKTKHEIKLEDGGTLSDETTYTAVGIEKVKTKAGEFDAMLIKSTGSAVDRGTKYRIDTRGWYVENRSAVKLEIERSEAGGSSSTMIIEEAP